MIMRLCIFQLLELAVFRICLHRPSRRIFLIMFALQITCSVCRHDRDLGLVPAQLHHSQHHARKREKDAAAGRTCRGFCTRSVCCLCAMTPARVHRVCCAGSSNEGQAWSRAAQQHIRSLLVTWCDWLQQHGCGSSGDDSALVSEACDALLKRLKAASSSSLRDCVWRLWASLVIDGSSSSGSSSSIMDISSSSSFDLVISFPDDFFLSPDASTGEAASAAAAAAAAAAFAKTLATLASGFAVVRPEAPCLLRVAVDASQSGEQFADMALSICAAASSSHPSENCAGNCNSSGRRSLWHGW